MQYRLTLECFVLVGDWRLLWFRRVTVPERSGSSDEKAGGVWATKIRSAPALCEPTKARDLAGGRVRMDG